MSTITTTINTSTIDFFFCMIHLKGVINRKVTATDMNEDFTLTSMFFNFLSFSKKWPRMSQSNKFYILYRFTDCLS